MKPVAALLLLSLAGTAASCTATASGETAGGPAAKAATEIAEVQGTLNLNIGRKAEEPGRMIVGSGAGTAQGGLIVAPGSTGASFEDVPDLGIQLQDAPETSDDLLAPKAAPSDEDDIVRLPQ
ncbi:MAG: hypothetical protein WEA77_15860 [Hyphomonas sp.]|uniref:hypothetical protein n=1 Tax=Hyphomonas sp. TaxID=87 RepID=UPI00349FF5AA